MRLVEHVLATYASIELEDILYITYDSMYLGKYMYFCYTNSR